MARLRPRIEVHVDQAAWIGLPAQDKRCCIVTQGAR